jgi:hypothetical protein
MSQSTQTSEQLQSRISLLEREVGAIDFDISLRGGYMKSEEYMGLLRQRTGRIEERDALVARLQCLREIEREKNGLRGAA